MKQSLYLFNGRDALGRPASLRVEAGRIADPLPRDGDRHVDLRGGRLLPGLINAHDHLQLNALPRLKYRERYEHANQWSDDIDPRRATDAQLLANAAVPRAQRLLIGGLKNLLSGVTTVAHHDPFYDELAAPGFPVRVLSRYGWAHSLALQGEAAVQASQRETPPEQPWIIHAAEGIGAEAAAEFDRLDALGCIGPDTVLVHGLALDAAQQRCLNQAGGGLVWCPGSNLHLFGRTLSAETLSRQTRLALGSDSRISGERDLLAELALARECSGWNEARLEALVTGRAAALLGLRDRGGLGCGQGADVLVLQSGIALSRATRADVRLVLIDGEPRYADPDLGDELGVGDALVPVQVDGHAKLLAAELVAALRAAVIQEAGLDLQHHPHRMTEAVS
ncbi:MAG TPA: hypothetical protein VGM81_01065 [Burkholderiaceae bacterium]|jgi:cytosine/adenosine deaminase-related metal-dependent hydrolase